MSELRGGGDVDLLRRPAEQQQTELTGNPRIEVPRPQSRGEGLDGRGVIADQITVTDRGKEIDVAFGVEIPEAVINQIATAEVVRRQIVAGKDGSAVGTLRLQVVGDVVVLPGIEAAVTGEYSGAAMRAALVDVDVVGPGELGGGQLAPEGDVVL